MVDVTPQEVKDQIHEVVKQFFDRHRDELTTYGDAMGWLHETDCEVVRQEAGTIGRSQFSCDIIWLTSMFGPWAEIDFDTLKPKQRKLKPDYIPPEPEPEPEPKKPKAKRGRPKKNSKKGPTNALGETVVVKEPEEETPVETIEQSPTQADTPRRKRRAGRVPPGALGEE